MVHDMSTIEIELDMTDKALTTRFSKALIGYENIVILSFYFPGCSPLLILNQNLVKCTVSSRNSTLRALISSIGMETIRSCPSARNQLNLPSTASGFQRYLMSILPTGSQSAFVSSMT